MSIRRIRRAAREGRYEFTLHALEEMDEDRLTEAHVRDALLRGRITMQLVGDTRGIRFVVRGRLKVEAHDVEVVCRFLQSGILRIITAYRLED